jgi:hypothetical protein
MIIHEADAANDTTLYVDPAMVEDIGMGEIFKINLSVTDVVALYTWQTKLLFDPSVLNCTEAAYPMTGGIFEGKTIIPVSPEIDNSEGYVLFGASLMGLDSVSGSGILCQITFEVLAIGESPLEFSDYGGATFLLDENLETISVTVQDGYFANVPTPSHDVAVTDLSLSDDRPLQNESVTISVQVLNNGTASETFNVTASYDGNLIELQSVTSLGAGDETTLTFNWNTTGVPVGSHTIRVEADAVPGETKTTNNLKIAAVVVVSPTAMSTDVNGDGFVDMKDIGEAAKAYGADMDHPRWNPGADINGDGIINLFDIALIAHDFGKQSV